MPTPTVTVAIPTLHAGPLLSECVESLERQTFRDFEGVIIDNSGEGKVKPMSLPPNFRVVENTANVGYGAAVNQAARLSASPLVAVLNDDAAADPGWLAALVAAFERHPRVGMCACRVLLEPAGTIDSAGMLLCADGSSKQRGHGQPPDRYPNEEDALLPSGSAAMYRRKLLDQTGGFDESFFLYCEDTDLGLRARWLGWGCLYVPGAMVRHRYSSSAGRISPLKAYLVERNRIFLLAKNFPIRALVPVPFAGTARYYFHATLASGLGAESRRQYSPLRLAWWLIKAHLAVLPHLPRLIAQRMAIRRTAAISAAEFTSLLRRFAISPREVASQ